MKHQKLEAPSTQALFGKFEPMLVRAEPRRPFREPDQDLDEVVYVYTGLLAIYRPDNVGHRAIVALRYPDEAILAGGRAGGFGVRALIRSDLAVGRSAANREALYLMLAQRNEAIAHEWLVRAHLDADARVAHLLCETAIRGGHGTLGMYCPFTQMHIGEITGQTSVNVNRVLADFERHRLIERTGRSITFLNWLELARLGSFRPEYLDG